MPLKYFLIFHLLHLEKALTEVEADIAKLEALPKETEKMKHFFEINEYALQMMMISFVEHFFS